MSSLFFTNLDALNEAISQKNYEYALSMVAQHVGSIKFSEEYRGSHVFMPELDDLVQRIGQAKTQQFLSDFAYPVDSNRDMLVVLATELYNFGGHTKVIEDMVLHHQGPSMIILTDLYGSYSNGGLSIGEIQEKFPINTSIFITPAIFLHRKVDYIINLLLTLGPRNIVIAAHHDDVVAYASANASVNANHIFLHHADHNPSLGSTVGHYRHVDVSINVKNICSDILAKQTEYLPLYVDDMGVKTFLNGTDNFSTVTSGSEAKFFSHGATLYCEFIEALASEIPGKHYHIGPIPEEYLLQIINHLIVRGINPDKFCHIPWVSSLWSTLLEIDAHVYFSSFPMHGGRAAAEVLGCGYPVISWVEHQPSDKIFLRTEYVYPEGTPTWGATSEIGSALSYVKENHASLSSRSRQFYCQNHSQEVFLDALRRMYAG